MRMHRASRSAEQRVTLQVGARVTQDFALEVGQTTSTVTVSENPVQVNTETQTLSNCGK